MNAFSCGEKERERDFHINRISINITPTNTKFCNQKFNLINFLYTDSNMYTLKRYYPYNAVILVAWVCTKIQLDK